MQMTRTFFVLWAVSWAIVAFFVLGFTAAAMAEPPESRKGGDEYNLERIDDATARFCYYNSHNKISTGYSEKYPLIYEAHGLRIEVIVKIGLAETITVLPPSGWYADPHQMEIFDGDEACFVIKHIPIG